MKQRIVAEQERGVAEVSQALVEYATAHQYGLAIWRLPHSAEIHYLVSFAPEETLETAIEKMPPGFVVAGFEQGIAGKKFFLAADVYFSSEGAPEERDLAFLAEKLSDFTIADIPEDTLAVPLPPADPVSRESFESLVGKAISQIEEGKFRKLVLARKKEVALSGPLAIGPLYEKMCTNYPATFNSLIYLPQSGVWMGASPETLVSLSAQRIFKTVALAGTQKVNGRTEKESNWSQKEIEEQAYVSRYIVDRLKKIRLREFDDIGPKTIKVGEIFHLKTDYIVDLKEVDFPDLLSTLLQLLHPTSAVCGMPREEAISFVLDNEGFKRELYGGFLGPVNIQEEIHLFVNLRCAKVNTALTFYAGAGITEDSDPAKEFLETELKLETLLSLFRQ